MKRTLTLLLACLLVLSAYAQTPQFKPEVFELLNLDYPGLERVKERHNEGNDIEAAEALLEYFRGRKGFRTLKIKDVSKVEITKEEQVWADEALAHTFFAHKGYQPSYNYGQDINWKYWPVKDNELRWQLHRHKWFVPMGRAYRVSKDEKYAIEWTKQYIDWIRKNPYVTIKRNEFEILSDSVLEGDAENARFAWRPLEVSHRLQDQPVQFQLFIDSPAFTPEFLTEFLVNYYRHAEHIMGNWSKHGNHLLYEAQRMICAGVFFPEFRSAKAWRDSGVEILNQEIKVQVLPDGCQFELCPHYHLGSIYTFVDALEVADINGLRDVFPQSYIDTIEKMILFYANISYPDYTNPCFSDARLVSKKNMIGSFKSWSALFPENQAIRYWATEGKEGALPENLSIGYLNSGYFVFRNGWDQPSTQMVVKAGPPAFWHNQPDNGTFELWYDGKILFQDSGSYVYGGDKEVMAQRELFRRTSMHNTLVLDGKNLENTDSKTLLWKPEGDIQILVTENQSYQNLKHRRSIFFVDGQYFVIVDEAVGDAKGMIELHYQMPLRKTASLAMAFNTEDEDGSNMKLQCFGPKGMVLEKGTGWVSTAYMKKRERMNASFNVRKVDDKPIRYITVIVPKQGAENPKITASFINKEFNQNSLKLVVKVGKNKKRTLTYEL